MARDSFNEQKNKNVYSSTKKKKKKTTKTVVKKPQSSSVSSQQRTVDPKEARRQESQAQAKSTVKKVQSTIQKAQQTAPTRRTAGQNQKTYGNTEGVAQTINIPKRTAQQKAEDRARGQRVKSGIQTAEDERKIRERNEHAVEVAKNTGRASVKGAKDTLTGYGKTMADVDEMAKSNEKWTEAKAMKLGVDRNDKKKMDEIEKERQESIKQSREFRMDLQRKQEERQAKFDEQTKDANELEKALYGAAESGTGMLIDTGIGAVTGTGQIGALASMGLRSYGTARGQAEKEGATASEDRLYSLASAGKEVATELMFQGAGLAKGYAVSKSGKAVGLSLADKAANALTKGLTGKKADIVSAGVKVLGGTGEENIEELAGWMVDPVIKELTYGKNVRNRMKENLRANIPQIGSDADAANVASYFSTPQFTDELTSEYVKSGLSKEQASELAAEMRDYYVAYYSGDNAKLDALETDLAAKLSGQDKLSTKSWSMDELKDTFASTTLLTLATGIPGAVNTSVKGNRIFDSDEVKAVFGDDAVRKVADAVKNTSDKEMSLKAETMKDRLDSGKDLTGTQKYDLYQGYLDKVNETAKKAKASYGVVENAREEQDLVPTMGRDKTGNTVYAKATQREFNEKFASTELTVEALKSYMESDNSISDDESRRANAVKKAVADIHVGGLTVGDAHEFAYGNTLAREALKAEEGIDLDQYIVRNADGTVDLSATNEATENALFQMNADNAIKAAQVETEVFKDDYRGNIDRDVMSRFGNNGQAIWKEVNKDLDPRDLQNYLTTANAASYFYSAGRNTDMGVDEAVNRYADTFKTVDNSVLKRAYAAGARDRIIANTPGYGQTVESGSNIQLKKTKPILTGQLIMDKDVVIPDSDQSAYLALAMSTNTNIHIVSSLKSKQGVEINGMSHGNDIYLNMNAAAESNLGYVFMHEMTHQIKQYAPNEYLALENLVRDRWFNKDQKGMQKAIKDRIDLYSTKGGQQLTEEEAVEEIIADAMAEAMDDPDFAAQVCEEDINLGQAILNSIREALRSIRNMFANNEFRNERFHNSLLSYLGILDEAEKMWLDALATARQNKANGLIADWQDRANKQNTERLSMLTTSEMPSMEDVDQTNTLITSDNGDAVAQFQEDGAVSFSISSYENEGRKIYKDYLDKLVNDKELSQKEATDMLRELETIYDISKRFADSGRFEPYTAWSYADVVTDAKGKPVFSSIRKNSEYKMNIDFSTICKKRRTLDAVFREMIRRGMFEKLDLNKDESAAMVVNINNLIRKNKFEAACALCFVEARRYRQQQTAKTFTNMWNELVESMYSDKDKIAYFNFGRDEQVQDVPDGIHTMDDSQLDLSHVRAVAEELNDKGKPKQTAEAKAARLILNNPEQRKLMRVGDMMASTGFENMHVENPELEKVYNSKKGTGGAKSSFGDVQYLNEIINSKTFDRQKAYDVSGVRIQSFSDYVPRMVFDYVQVIADLAAKKLPAHAYTKEVLFVLQFGLTGAKVNMSLVPDVVADGKAPGLDKDGNYAWNAEGTFPWEDYTDEKGRKWPGARSIQKANGYKENCGTIAVGISDKQIMKMLADPEIQMVIPYHKSSLNPIVAAMTNVDRFTNYEDFQNTKNAEGKAVKTDFAWDKKLFGLTHYTRGEKKGELKPTDKWGNVQDLVKEYVDWCESKNYTPKFSQFLYLKEDNDPDKDFVLDENGNKIINPGYYKMLEDFALMDNDGNFKPQGDVHMQFPTAETGIDGMSMESLIERGLTDDTELEAMRSEKIGGIVDEIDEMFNEGTLTEQSVASQKLAQRLSISPEMDDEYMNAVNNGNMDEAQRLVDKAAAESGMRVAHRYHGTMNAGFTVFDKAYAKVGGNSGAGFYFSTSKDDSENHYQDVEGADNYFKWSSLAEHINQQIEDGEWDGPELETYEDVEEYAKDQLNANPGTYDVYLNYSNPYVRDYRNSTNIYDKIMDGFDESVIDRDDYDDEDDYNDALFEERYNYLSEAIYEAVYNANSDLEDNYEVLYGPQISEIAASIAEQAYDYEKITWDDIKEALYQLGETEVISDNWTESADATTEFTRAIIENFGFDAIEDKEVSSKFGQLSREMATDTEHVIVFKPEQIKLSDPVTYAEDGSVIPLSKRFDPSNNDIRYSLPTTDADGNILTDGQMEYFKNSQARDIFGRLVPVYHATSMGGFTIFNPEYSNDKRSLFFSSKWQVAQTYAANAENRIGYDSREISSWNDLVNYAKELAESAGTEWEPDEEAESLGWAIRRKDNDNYAHFEIADSFDEAYETWLQMVEDNDPRLDDYKVQIELQYAEGEDIMTQEIEGDNYESLLENVSNASIPKPGYYAAYLNLENPLIIEGHGQPWNDIVDGGSVFPAFSYVRVKDAEWYREDAENADEMYAVGQRLYNGDDSRAKAEELSAGGLVEIEIFDGEKKHKATISPDADSIGQEIANVFGIDDMEMVSGIAEEMALDMEVSNSTRFDATDMRNTIGEYGYSTREWAEFAEDEGYDGVIFRNIVDIDDKTEIDEEDAASDVYVAFSSNQVKDINNENPSENPDIRYSIATRDEVSGYLMQKAESITDIPLQDARLEENRIRYSLDATDFENSIVSEWDRRKRNLAEDVKDTPLRRSLIRLMKQVRTDSGEDKQYSTETIDETIRSLKKMYYYAKGDKAKDFAREAWDAAERIVGDINYNDVQYLHYKGISNYFADTEIHVPEELIDDDTFIQFAKTNAGRIRLFADEGIEIEEAWKSLHDAYPDLFPRAAFVADSPVGMLIQMDWVLNQLEPYKEAYTSEEHSKLVEDIANTLCSIVEEGNEYNATVNDLNVRAMRQRHSEALRKVQEQEKQKRDNQKERAEKWKQKYLERVEKNKADKEAGKQKKNEAKLVGDIEKNIKWLSDRLRPETRTKDNAIPEQFRSALGALLAEFDLQSKGSKKIEKKKGYPSKTTLKLKQLREQYAAIAKENDDDGNNVFRYNGDLLVKMDELIKTMESLDKFFDKRYGREVTIADLSLSEMFVIDTMLKSLVHEFREYKNVTINSKRTEIAGVSSEVIGDMDTQIGRHGAAREGGALGRINGLLNMAEVTPIYFFKRLGAMYKMYRELRKGFDKYIENDREVIKRLSEIMSGYYNKKNPGTTIESWRTTEDAQTFNFEHGPVTLSVAQMMEVYLYANRPQAFGHMIGDGIIVTPISPAGKIENAKEKLLGHQPMVDPVRLTYENVQEIISKLSEEQVNMANKLQELVAGYMSDLGNETTMKLYGYKMFDDPNYFGIHVSQTATNSSVDAPAITETIKNFGWTKPLTPGAKNTIVIGDIFTDVARYCNEMNQFNAYAVPVSDFMRVYNYTLRDENGELQGSAKSAIIKAFGKQAHTYIMNFLRDLNGSSMRRNGGLEGMIDAALGRAKKAAVFMNMRVALQQPTAIVRALAQVNARYFVGVRPSAAATKEMIEHCPIAQWKAWGFYDTHFGRDVEDLIMNNWSKADVVGSALYGALDNMTWGMIWQAVKNEVDADIKKRGLDIKKGSQEYWDMCNDRASEVFDSTQVVDSPFHRSDAMRSKDTLVKQFTSFQAEPTLSFNVIRDFAVQAYDAVADGDKTKAAKLIAKGVEVWTLQAAVVAVAQSLWDAVRHKDPDGDDDEDEGFLELWWQNFMADFVDDLKFYNNIYFLKEFTPYAEKLVDYMKTGKWDTYDSNKLLMFQGAEKMTQGLQQLIKKIQKGDEYKHKNGEPYTWYEVMTNFLGGVGYLTGMPIGTVMRDAQSILKWFHINAFAADGSEKTDKRLADAIAEKMGYQKTGSSSDNVASGATSKESETDKDESADNQADIEQKVTDYRESLSDNFTDEEKDELVKQYEKRIKKGVKSEEVADRDKDTMLFDAEKAAAGYEGTERDKRIWQSVSQGYKSHVESGDYAYIARMRSVVEQAGGNLDYFDEQIVKASKTALKKTIEPGGADTESEMVAQQNIRYYLQGHGVTQEEISSEIVYKCAAAKDLKVAFRLGDEQAIVESSYPLLFAGLTTTDYEKIYTNRNRIDLSKYDGKYKDRLKSTGTFVWPTQGTITSHFGARNAPTRGASSNHPAIDIGAPKGTPVVAADGGVVIYAGTNGGYGNSVGIKHDNGMVTYYNHLSAWNVNVGDTVGQGQQIAAVGSTGISTGPHLDFKILDTNGKPVDPEMYLNKRS